MSDERINPFGDLGDFGIENKKTKPSKSVIDQVAQDNGFPSRQPIKQTEIAPLRLQRRYVTGRNQQINIKAKAETITKFHSLADQLNVPLGEVLEQALRALEKSLNGI